MSTSISDKHQTSLKKFPNIDKIEQAALALPQVDCPVAHHFGPNIYIREVTLPEGAFVIGHAQKQDHLNIMLTGKVAMVNDGEVKILEAPMVFIGKPGKKMGYIMETCIWQNIYATDETNIDKLEEMFLDKSEAWENFDIEQRMINEALRKEDRDDFFNFLSNEDISPDLVRSQSEIEDDQIPMPEGFGAIATVRDSDIEGKGLFLTWPIEAGAIIAPARLGGMRTPAGRYTNHSKNPNAEFKMVGNGDIYLISKRAIRGCVGGDKGEEITVDYRNSLKLARDQKCQE